MTNHLHHAPGAEPQSGHVGVFIVDDHDGYRSLVAEVIAATDGFSVMGMSASWAEAKRQLVAGQPLPDLVFMDVNLGDESGVAAARELTTAWPDIKVVLISTLEAADLPPQATGSASGFLPKSQLSPAHIADAWRGAYDWQR